MRSRLAGPISWVKHHLKLALLMAVSALAGAAALAAASVPDASGVIHACYATSGGVPSPSNAPNVWIIDPSAGQSCNTPGGPTGNARALNFNQTGPAGANGANGADGAQGPPGTFTPGPPVGHVVMVNNAGQISFDLLGLTVPDSPSKYAGSGQGHVPPPAYMLDKALDQATPKLEQGAVNGGLFKTVTITIYAPGSTAPMVVYTLKTAHITGDNIKTDASSRILESLTLIAKSVSAKSPPITTNTIRPPIKFH